MVGIPTNTKCITRQVSRQPPSLAVAQAGTETLCRLSAWRLLVGSSLRPGLHTPSRTHALPPTDCLTPCGAGDMALTARPQGAQQGRATPARSGARGRPPRGSPCGGGARRPPADKEG